MMSRPNGVTVFAVLLFAGCEPTKEGAVGHRGGDTPPEGAVQIQCDDRVWGAVLQGDSDWRRKSVIAGPLALYPARTEFPNTPEEVLAPVITTARGRRFAADQLKLHLIIRNGERATLTIADDARAEAAFLFRVPYKRKGYYIDEGQSALALRGCGKQGRYTNYWTTLIVDGPQCLPIQVFIEGQPEPIERRMAIGAQPC